MDWFERQKDKRAKKQEGKKDKKVISVAKQYLEQQCVARFERQKDKKAKEAKKTKKYLSCKTIFGATMRGPV